MRVSRTVPKSPNASPTRREPDDRASGALPRTLKARSRPGDTTLQRHASFFDDDGDRGVDVAECTRGLKALGLPLGVAEAAALAIVAPLSIQTRGSLLALNIDIENIQKGKHDSDTGILDKRGRFNAGRFDKVFGACSTFDRNGDKAFTATELTRMISANRETLLGWLVSTGRVAGVARTGSGHEGRRARQDGACLERRQIEVVLRRHALLQAREGTRIELARRPRGSCHGQSNEMRKSGGTPRLH